MEDTRNQAAGNVSNKNNIEATTTIDIKVLDAIQHIVTPEQVEIFLRKIPVRLYKIISNDGRIPVELEHRFYSICNHIMSDADELASLIARLK